LQLGGVGGKQCGLKRRLEAAEAQLQEREQPFEKHEQINR
jgi:hypothetical protein